jgi:hypothetical protein
MKYTIVSKRVTPFVYQRLVYKGGQIFPEGPGVVINGGAGIVGGADLLSGLPMERRSLLVPNAVKTVIDEKAYDYLKGVPKFLSDVKRGLIEVVKGEIDDGKMNKIADSMIEDDHIPNRPISEEDIEAAGGFIQKDGSVNITEAAEDPAKVRRENAGQPSYVKKRNAQRRSANRGRR